MKSHWNWSQLVNQNILLCIIGIFFLSMPYKARSEVCSFGANDIDSLSKPLSINPGRYFDLNNTASCDGNITSIRYCLLDTNPTNNFSVQIWRKANDGYTMMKEYPINVTMSHNDGILINNSNAVCKRITINGENSFQVFTGDIIGLYFETATFGILATSSSHSDYGLYYDTRTGTEVQEEMSVALTDLSFNTTIQYHLKVQVGNELTSPEQRLSTIMKTQQTAAQYSSSPIIFQTSTSKLIKHIAPTASQLMTEVAISTSSFGTKVQMTAQPTEFILTISTSVPMTILPTPIPSRMPEATTSLSLSLNTKSSKLNTPLPTNVQVSATSEKSRDYVKASLVPPVPPGRPDNQVNSQTIIMIAGVSAGCAVLVLLVAIAIVVCTILARSRRAVLVHSSKKVNSRLQENNVFEFNNNTVSNSIPETVLVNEIHLTEISLPCSQDSSQGNVSEDDNYNRLQNGVPSSNKHMSVHIYNTIETLRREQPFLLIGAPTERSQSEMNDYEIPVPSLGNTTAAISLESVQASTRTTMTFIPTDYEVPQSLSGYFSDGTVQCASSSSSYMSIPEEPFAIDSDLELWRKCKQQLDTAVQKQNRTETRTRSRAASMDGPYNPPPSDLAQLHRKLKELSIEIISMKEIRTDLGMLQSSLITQKAVLKKKSGHERQVIIQSPDPAGTETQATALLLQEAVIMGQIRHPNVVSLHGLIMEDKKVMLVVEQFPKEDLRRYLVQMGRSVIHEDAPKLLLTFSQQVALGMHYLASKGFVHRDLAARNVFVTKNDTCKVGELAKCLEYADPEDYVINGGKLPIRWMPPEAMYRKRYSTASDVWSYGCLLYEIWSLGRMPFREYTNAQVIEKIDSGYRIPPPPGCPRVIYDLMIQCWHPYPLSRPTFKDILNTLLGDEAQVLQIPAKDAATHDAAIVLGAKLEAGKYLYRDLQTMHIERPGVQKFPVGLHDSRPIRPRSPQISKRPQRSSDYDHISHSKVMMTAFPTSSAAIDHMYKSQPKNKKGNGTAVEYDFDPSTFLFRQRLLTDDRSDYADIGD